MNYYRVELIRMKLKTVFVEPDEREVRLFSSMELVEKWLMDNDFIYGQRRFFNYPTGDREWFHKDDISMEWVKVTISEMNLDDFAESKFKKLAEIHEELLSKIREAERRYEEARDIKLAECNILIPLICKMLQKHYTISKIAEELGQPEERIEKLCKVAQKYEPEYDAEKICNEIMEEY